MIVIDSSFAIAALIDEDHSEYVRDMVLAFEAVSFVAPKLIWWEFANVVQQKVRRGILSAEEQVAVWDRFLNLGIETAANPAFQDLPELARLSSTYGLSAYDAAYLQLALSEGASLATLDKPLARAAAAERVLVICPTPMIAP
ncbi:MAG: twitching motility protein PilT [Caulobacter sp.]|nr:twitching motility protein PilT [Caulobacter sp.]